MIIPALCQHNSGSLDHHVRCTKDGRVVWTDCTSWHWGEYPRCSYTEPDNSPEACRARLNYLRNH